MYCEIPTFKRCCCCLPLRAGLLGYAYFKLALVLLYLIFYLYGIILTNIDFNTFNFNAFYGIYIIVPFVAFAIDISMTAAFVIGGHMKKPIPLKVYMWYIIVSTALVVLLQTFVFFATPWRYREPIFVSTALTVVIQLYLIFLIRSQIIKLEPKQDAVYQNFDEKPNIIIEDTRNPKLQNI